MESLSVSALGWSIVAAVLGATLVCFLVLKYGFGTDDEIPDPRIRRRSLTRLGHGLAALLFGLAAVLAFYSVADGTRRPLTFTARLREPVRALEQRLRAAEKVARQMVVNLGEILRRAETSRQGPVEIPRPAPAVTTKPAARSMERSADLRPTRPPVEPPPARLPAASPTEPPSPKPPAAVTESTLPVLGSALPRTAVRPAAREFAASSAPPAPSERSSPTASTPPGTIMSIPPETETTSVPILVITVPPLTPAMPRGSRAPGPPEHARGQRADNEEKHERRRELPGHAERHGRSDREARLERAQRGGERAEAFERTWDRLRPERQERIERSGRSNRIERSARVERAERVEWPERVDRVERPDRLERIERPERAERPERVERVERSGRAERVERHERPGR